MFWNGSEVFERAAGLAGCVAAGWGLGSSGGSRGTACTGAAARLGLGRRVENGVTHGVAQGGGQGLRFLACGVRRQCATALQAGQRLVGDTEAGDGDHTIGHQIIGIALEYFLGCDDRAGVLALVELQLCDAYPRLLARRVGLGRQFERTDRGIGAASGDLCFGVAQRRFERHDLGLLRRR